MKPRILILAGEPPESLGGMEHVIRELAKGLEQRGYTVEVLHRGNSSPGWIARPANKWQSYAADVLLGWYHRRKVQERMGEDVVAVLSNGLLGWCLPGIPSWVKKIHMYHGTYRGASKAMQSFISFAGARKLRWWDSMVLERGSGRNKQIICNSDQTRDEVLKYFGYQGATVWLPLDTSHFRPLDKEDARLRFSIPLEAKVGMFVGSTQPQKGFPVVRALLEALPELKWVLALRGGVPEDLKDMKNVLVFRNASPQILPWLYNAVDFTICPSCYESFGYVVAEALSCGTPVVASPGGASRRFLSKARFSGFLVSRFDAIDEFLFAIREILRDPHSCRASILEHIRPEVEKTMSPENWFTHFCELTGL